MCAALLLGLCASPASADEPVVTVCPYGDAIPPATGCALPPLVAARAAGATAPATRIRLPPPTDQVLDPYAANPYPAQADGAGEILDPYAPMRMSMVVLPNAAPDVDAVLDPYPSAPKPARKPARPRTHHAE